jgi:hypothetical protein
MERALKLETYSNNQGTYTHKAGIEKSAGFFYRSPVLVL